LINSETALIAQFLRPKKDYFFLQRRTQLPLKTKVLSFLLYSFLIKIAAVGWKAVYFHSQFVFLSSMFFMLYIVLLQAEDFKLG